MSRQAASQWGDDRAEPRDEVMLRTRATDGSGRPLVMTIVNLSPGGLMARCDAALSVGDALSIELPDAGRLRGEVRWALGGRIGCRFDEAVSAARYYPMLMAVRAR